MYIHRIVIDADRINARGQRVAMNYLEQLCQLGLVEILGTTTLPVDVPRHKFEKGHVKGTSYPRIGSDGVFYLTKGQVPDGNVGVPAGRSRFQEIHGTIFGHLSRSDKQQEHDRRDALHVDQANQNHADFFITGEKHILTAGQALTALGIKPIVCSDDECLALVQKHFAEYFGTTDPQQLKARLDSLGPVLVGSNSCGNTQFMDVLVNEELLAFDVTSDSITITANVYNDKGALLLKVTPGKPLQFMGPGFSVSGESGGRLPAVVLLGEERVSAFAIVDENEDAVFAGRMLTSGRLLIYYARLHNRDGQVAIEVKNGSLATSRIEVQSRSQAA